MSSTRCPGKVLRVAGGKPLLGWLLDGVEGAEVNLAVCVATSADESDDPIAEYCSDRGTEFFRGPLENVALRLLKASRGHDYFIRLCADSPCLDAREIRVAAGLVRLGVDLVTNVPAAGNSVEVIKYNALAAVYPKMTAGEREHVTLYFYRHPEEFRIKRFKSEPGVLVDTEADWENFKRTQEGVL